MSDGKYFSTTKKGEIVEFRQDLHSLDRSKKKEAVKKVIAAMTVGKDVSILFPDVVNCMQTDDLELKKLVYLYLINYAKTQPDLAIMGVNTFVKDSQDPNPLIRALAVRTMGCIRVDKITEYLCDPLQRTLKDEDPYVRKTAAMCVAKLHDINAELVEDRGFLDSLKDLLADSNPMVVANAVAALAEIQEVSSKNVMPLNQSAHGKLLRALNECTEWGQVFILDSLASYSATDAKEAEGIIERVAPRLQHANSAVVLSAIKVILKQLEVASDENLKLSMHKKMAPPLITLLGGESELQYVALRNISLIVQKYPQLLSQEVKVFFCKYNDPIYVKMEKLEIMIRLANERNVDQVLLEFKEYATEVDVDFVRKAVRAIGRCAVSLNDAAERCINVLLELIKTKVEYVVQESIVVIKDIFRRYPNRYESIIATLCENLETLDEPEAKASMIWIIGEYAERIDNADELLEFFLETFPEESSQVQLQLITAAVKLFLKKPTARPQQMIQLVLTYATQETDNPDLRDRAYVYWRLLSTDPEAAKEVVLAEKPNIDDSSSQMEPALLESLLKNLSSLSSVYHKPPDAFVSRTRVAVQKAEDLQPIQQQIEFNAASPITDQGVQGQAVPDLMGDLLDLGDDSAPSHIADTQNFAAQPAVGPSDILTDLNELDVNHGAVAAPSAPFGGALSGLSADLRPEAANRARLSVVLDANAGKGLTVSARLSSRDNRPVYLLEFQNGTAGALDTFMIQFNKNSFGLAPANQSIAIATIQPGVAAKATVPLLQNQDLLSPAAASAVLQVAIRNKQQGVFYYSDSILVDAVVDRQATLQPSAFIPLWRELSDANEAIQTISHSSNVDAILSALSQTFTLQARKQLPGGGEVAFLAAKLRTLPVPADVLVELRFSASQIRAAVKTARPDISKLAVDGLQQLVRDSGL